MLHIIKLNKYEFKRIEDGDQSFIFAKNDVEYKQFDQIVLVNTFYTESGFKENDLRTDGKLILVDVLNVFNHRHIGVKKGFCLINFLM